MSEHTPTPWEIHHLTHCQGEYWCSIGHHGCGPIVDIVGTEGNKAEFYIPVAGMKFYAIPVEQQKANADFIVRAVNCHDELVNSHEPDREGPAFLNWIADRLVHVYGESENTDFVICLRRRAKKAHTALAKVRGQSDD